MTTQALTLTDFLLARFAEDEAEAEHVWHFGVEIGGDGCPSGVHTDLTTRVLAECEAKRRIVGQVKMWEAWSDSDPARRPALNMFYPIARILALPYVDHPDYREEWRS